MRGRPKTATPRRRPRRGALQAEPWGGLADVKSSSFDSFVSIARAARELCVSRERVVGLIGEGALRATCAAGRWRIERQALDALLRMRRGFHSPPSGGRAA